jgi:hypothetical protein
MVSDMRNTEFLENILYDLWENHFCDIPRRNLVIIKYGKYSKRQLGSIKLANKGTKIKGLLKKKEQDYIAQDDKRITVITVTRYFQNEIVPEFVVRATIAHELCHYAHGFSSPLEKRFQKPHQGSVIKKELKKRGLLEKQIEADKWFKENWLDIISS